MPDNTSKTGPGGTVDADKSAPPYEGRTTGDDRDEERKASVERQLADADPGKPGQVASPPQESPVDEREVTDSAPASPQGVGDSPSRSGEEIKADDGKEPGRKDLPRDPKTGRPAGTSDKRDITGVG